MLEFSDAPYQFFEPKPCRFTIQLLRGINRRFVLTGPNHRLAEIEIEGAVEAVKKAQSDGAHLLFVMNHPSHSDPQVITEIHRRLGVPSCFMAAYDVFLRGKAQAWLMQRLGNFSIDRDGSDRKAMSEANRILTEGNYALNIFPEGNVYLTNDRVTPFLDGTAFIALQAQKKLKDKELLVVPISLKFTHLTLPRETIRRRLIQLGKDSEHSYDPGVDPIGAVMGLGTHLVADFLRRHAYGDKISTEPEHLSETLSQFASSLVEELETSMHLSASPDDSLVDRIRRIRSTIHQWRLTDSPENTSDEINALADKAILAFRIHGYITPYLFDHPTVDRFSETVERIAEDYYSKAMPPVGPRRAHAVIGQPFPVSDHLEASGGKLRNAVGPLTAEMEKKVQAGIDEINERNDAPGSLLLDEVSE